MSKDSDENAIPIGVAFDGVSKSTCPEGGVVIELRGKGIRRGGGGGGGIMSGEDEEEL
jgi:hypothetical protein